MEKKHDPGQLTGFYGWIERAGNKVPHPVYLFIWLWAITLIASLLLGKIGVSVKHPTTCLLYTSYSFLEEGELA